MPDLGFLKSLEEQRVWGWVPAPILVIVGDLGALLVSAWANTILKEPFQTEEWRWRIKFVF